MALILDKSITGVLTDGIGGTYTGYTNLTYTDPSGNVHENPYLVIDNVFINKLDKTVKIFYTIYKDNTTRLNRNKPVLENHESINRLDTFDQYFSSNGLDIFKQSYIYINQNFFIKWKSDEL